MNATSFVEGIAGFATSSHVQRHFRENPPTIIVGAPRSGTTVLQQIFAGQPQVTVLFEPFAIWQKVYGPRGDDTASGIVAAPDTSKRLRRHYFRSLQPGRPKLVSKDPRDSLHVDVLAQVFEGAKFIHMLRDGRDVASSIKETSRNALYVADQGWPHVRIRDYSTYLFEPPHVKGALVWRECVDEVEKSFSKLPAAQHLTVRYESLIDSPSEEAARVLRFALVHYEDAALQAAIEGISRIAVPNGQRASLAVEKNDWKSAMSAVSALVQNDAGSGTMSRGLRVGKWQTELSPDAQLECEQVFGDSLRRFGY